MVKHVVSALAICMAITGGTIVFGQIAEPASQGLPKAHVGSSHPHTPLHLEMRALDRRARTDMILYTGQFGHNGSAASAVHVNIITGTP
jgi:hypothetical protein